MNGNQASEGEKQPAEATTEATVAAADGANGNGLLAKKRKKEGLKPIITTEGDGQGQQAAGYVYHSFLHDIVFLHEFLYP